MKPRVLYLAGWGRSGTTLLANTLGQLDGYFSAGELYYVWDRGVLQNRLCGCGVPFRDCPVWRAVFATAFGGFDESLAREIVALRTTGVRTRSMVLAGSPDRRRRAISRSRALQVAVASLYPAICEVTNCKFVVDSSKFPHYAYLLSESDALDVYTVHFVRDPRAVAYSWWNRVKQDDASQGTQMRRVHPLRSAMFWNTWNSLLRSAWTEEQKRYLLLTYEDFVANPRAAVQGIVDFTGDSHLELPFESDREVRLRPCHTVAGNPNRFSNGTVAIKNDSEWEHKAAFWMRALVSAVTLPVRGGFGYGRRPRTTR